MHATMRIRRLGTKNNKTAIHAGSSRTDSATGIRVAKATPKITALQEYNTMRDECIQKLPLWGVECRDDYIAGARHCQLHLHCRTGVIPQSQT